MAKANMNLISVFVTKLWLLQALAGGGGGTKNIIPRNFLAMDLLSVYESFLLNTQFLAISSHLLSD